MTFLHLGDIIKQILQEQMLITEDSEIKDGEHQTKNEFRYRRNRRLRLVSPCKRSFNKGITIDNTSQNDPQAFNMPYIIAEWTEGKKERRHVDDLTNSIKSDTYGEKSIYAMII